MQHRRLTCLTRLLIVLLALPLGPGPAMAGAWMQQEGKGFAATHIVYRKDLIALQGLGIGRDLPVELGYYGEYGLNARWTLGVDLNVLRGGDAHALLFLRSPLPQLGKTHVAAELALGTNQREGRWLAMQRLTLSFGRGFQAELAGRDLSGWMALDLAHEWRSMGLETTWKLDATLGLNRPGQLAPLLQIETSKGSAGSATSITPSLRIPLGPDKFSASQELLLGIEHKRAGGARSLGVKLALWHRF